VQPQDGFAALGAPQPAAAQETPTAPHHREGQ
jgi:hypothetical protein